MGGARTELRLGRTAILVPLALALLAGAPGAHAEGGDGRPSDLTAMKTAKVDLRAALTYERMALASAKSRDAAKAHRELINSRGALNDGAEAIEQLTPPFQWSVDFRAINHRTEPWTQFADDWRNLLNMDFAAHQLAGPGLVRILSAAVSDKTAMLGFITRAIRDKCLELENLRGPIEVDGVPQGPSELTVTVSCDDGIDELELGTDGVVWTQADAGPDAVTMGAGGQVLEVDGKGAKSVTVTAEGNPDSAAGDQLVGDIVPIAGDSAPPFDEVL